jgi:diaminopimelate decarboxylase
VTVWDDSLAPGHRYDSSGTLHVGGAALDALATEYGTPQIVMDVATIEGAIARFHAACDPLGVRISYAAKAFVCTELLQLLLGSGVGIDVCSLGELAIAERAGYSARGLTLHGAGKTDSELAAVLEGRVGRIVIDGLSELARLARLANHARPVDVLLRLNTDVAVDTHRHVYTVGEDAKFGFTSDEEEAASAIIRSSPPLRLVGLHAHAGSQIADGSALIENARALAGAANRFAARGFVSRVLIAGGGFGVQYHPGRPNDELEIAPTVAACRDAIAEIVDFPSPRIEFEPGRSIVAHAGTTIYEVLSVKRRGERTLVVVDGGMADNPRPALYDAYHHVVSVAEKPRPKRLTDVYGRACENDFIAQTFLPDDIERGDLIAACTTGAYTYSMSSNYNCFPRPAVVGVNEGESSLWIGRS